MSARMEQSDLAASRAGCVHRNRLGRLPPTNVMNSRHCITVPKLRRELFRPPKTDASTLKVAIAIHVYVAKDWQTALKEFYPHYSACLCEHAPAR